MGQAVEALAQAEGHEVVARFGSKNPLLGVRDADELNGAEVVVDFSAPAVALDHLHRYGFWGVDAVVGTTGWYDGLPKVRAWVEEGQNGVLYAPNFSLGVALMVRALRAILPLLDGLAEYDPFVHEAHHAGKLDSPSGTALLLANEVVAGLAWKTRVEAETQHGRIAPDALHVTSTRAGHVVGEHRVGFDSVGDRLTLHHEAKDRRAFALGAVRAAAWLHGRKGLFTLDDLLDDLGFTANPPIPR